VRDFVQAAEQFENVRCTVSSHKSTWSVYAGRQNRLQAPGIVPWAQAWGILGKNARQKEIPAAVFELNNRQIGLLLSRMWEGDGHIDVRGRSLFYATASERMARQIQHLLLRLGVISRLRKVTFPYKEGRTGWQVFVTHNKNIAVFAEWIGFHFVSAGRKASLDAMIERDLPEAATKDIVPIAVKTLVCAAKERRGITWLEMNAACGVAQREFYPAHTASKRGFNRETVHRLSEYFEAPALRCLADNDIYWDEIVSIEYAGEKQTYDLEISGTHNFIANDILVHNSHAADYGIIAVQTGYLKAHYTVEYMTALMSVSKNEIEKVALYAADARRMGIEVAPPDVNSSEWDFSIEDCAPEAGKPPKSVIRFGLGAIKNVGQGPVDAILAARRKGGAFQDINDFSQRVDLRQVGKRALESMIKVGALDRFGSRQQLIGGMEQILSVSASHFRAADSGQMSLFGAHTGVTEHIHLPHAAQELSRREILNWERDLIGLYVSDHPLSPVMDAINQAITHFAGQLNDASHGEKVRVAGMVVRIRNHQTKSGSQMAFATLEDIQGLIELVLFPRTWEKVQSVFQIDQIVLVDGKIDNPDGGEPKILVDNVTTELKYFTAAPQTQVTELWPSTPPRKPAAVRERPPEKTPPHPKPQPPKAAEPIRPAAASTEEDFPPEPDLFPPDLYSELVPNGFVIEGARLPSLAAQPSEVESAPAAAVEEPESADPLDWIEIPALGGGAASEIPPTLQETEIPPAMKESTPAAFLAPIEPLTGPALTPYPADAQPIVPSEVHLLTVTLRTCGDKVRDNLRLRQLFGKLIANPGQDRFAVLVFESGRGYHIEFPNFTTRAAPELIGELQRLVGVENVRLEPVVFQ
jgi:hypothetical protein